MSANTGKIDVAVVGSTGRVGTRLLALIEQAADLKLVGEYASQSPRTWSSRPDVLIDFSSPQGTREWLAICRENRIPMVIGTTGLDAELNQAIDLAAAEIPIVQAANMSAGANLLMTLAAQTAAALGEDAQIEVVESHHCHKKDAPSGTARAIADSLAAARPGRRIPIHSMRLGDEIGRHSVHLAVSGERIELTHAATDRDVFARGALRAARWIAGRAPRRYSMSDVMCEVRR